MEILATMMRQNPNHRKAELWNSGFIIKGHQDKYRQKDMKMLAYIMQI